jgi:hypothetical protein
LWIKIIQRRASSKNAYHKKRGQVKAERRGERG